MKSTCARALALTAGISLLLMAGSASAQVKCWHKDDPTKRDPQLVAYLESWATGELSAALYLHPQFERRINGAHVRSFAGEPQSGKVEVVYTDADDYAEMLAALADQTEHVGGDPKLSLDGFPACEDDGSHVTKATIRWKWASTVLGSIHGEDVERTVGTRGTSVLEFEYDGGTSKNRLKVESVSFDAAGVDAQLGPGFNGRPRYADAHRLDVHVKPSRIKPLPAAGDKTTVKVHSGLVDSSGAPMAKEEILIAIDPETSTTGKPTFRVTTGANGKTRPTKVELKGPLAENGAVTIIAYYPPDPLAPILTAETKVKAGSGVGNLGGGSGDTCVFSGIITVNGNPAPQGTAVTCLDGTGTPPTTTTNSSGAYVCTPYAGTITLQANGQTAGPCPRPCVADASETCNANITGCGSPSVSFSLLLLPPVLLGRRLVQRRRHETA